MSYVTMKQCLETGVHFGHQTRRWNPKMKPYIFQKRKGIYIIDLQKTVKLANQALAFIKDEVAKGKTIMFVGTKKQSQSAIEDNAKRCGMPYVKERWLGGMLTNFEILRKSLNKLKKFEEMDGTAATDYMTKKELGIFKKELARLQKNLGGVKMLDKPPDMIFIVDLKKDEIGLNEAKKLNIPVIALVDTNCDPDPIDYPIPANDDAIRAISLFCGAVTDTVNEGRKIYEKMLEKENAESEDFPENEEFENKSSKSEEIKEDESKEEFNFEKTLADNSEKKSGEKEVEEEEK